METEELLSSLIENSKQFFELSVTYKPCLQFSHFKMKNKIINL